MPCNSDDAKATLLNVQLYFAFTYNKLQHTKFFRLLT
jgi:hypothetical protein